MSGARDAARGAASATGAAARAGRSATRGTARVIHWLTGAGGAGRTGLDKLIELTAAGSIGDAFVAVALAGTIFFSASVDQARGKVVLFLLITMAPFAVLVGTEMPAILVEVSCLSNEDEVKLLTTSDYREQIAAAILRGLRAYAHELTPAGRKDG